MAEPRPARQAVYFTALGVVVGLLLAGLAIPLALDDQGDALASAEGTTALRERQDVPGDAATSRASQEGQGDVRRPPGAEPGAAASPDSAPATDVPGADASDANATAADRDASATDPQSTDGPSQADDGGATQESGPQPQADPDRPLAATDRGVTPESIRLALMIFDLGGVSELGVAAPGSDPEQQRSWWGAWVDDLNERGGIHGRQVEPRYYQYDALSADSQRAACRQAAEDDGVFAALDTGAIGKGTVLCFTRETRTPFISLGSSGFTSLDYQRSEGFLFTMSAEGRRMMANFAADLDALDELREDNALGERQQKTLGILSVDNPGTHETVQHGLVDTLDQLGYEVAHWAELSGDLSTASSQVPVAVSEMRRHGVNAVLLLAGIFEATQFVQEAESQQYFPEYYATDWQAAWSETYAGNMPDSFDGTLITATRTGERRADYPDTPMTQECRRIYQEQTGQELSSDPDNVEGWSSMLTCQVFRSFEIGARAAGPDLTRDGFSQSLQSVGEIPLATFGGGSFSPGKFGAADLLRTALWDRSCECWLPASDFRQPRF